MSLHRTFKENVAQQFSDFGKKLKCYYYIESIIS